MCAVDDLIYVKKIGHFIKGHAEHKYILTTKLLLI